MAPSNVSVPVPPRPTEPDTLHVNEAGVAKRSHQKPTPRDVYNLRKACGWPDDSAPRESERSHHLRQALCATQRSDTGNYNSLHDEFVQRYRKSRSQAAEARYNVRIALRELGYYVDDDRSHLETFMSSISQIRGRDMTGSEIETAIISAVEQSGYRPLSSVTSPDDDTPLVLEGCGAEAGVPCPARSPPGSGREGVVKEAGPLDTSEHPTSGDPRRSNGNATTYLDDKWRRPPPYRPKPVESWTHLIGIKAAAQEPKAPHVQRGLERDSKTSHPDLLCTTLQSLFLSGVGAKPIRETGKVSTGHRRPRGPSPDSVFAKFQGVPGTRLKPLNDWNDEYDESSVYPEPRRQRAI